MKTRSLSICLLLLSLLFSGWTQAAVELNEDVPETYIVKKGRYPLGHLRYVPERALALAGAVGCQSAD